VWLVIGPAQDKHTGCSFLRVKLPVKAFLHPEHTKHDWCHFPPLALKWETTIFVSCC